MIYVLDYSKSVYDYEEKNNLLFWNMNTYNTRKVLCEKVRVIATVRDLHSLNSAIDGSVMSQLSQLILSKSLVFLHGIFYFWLVEQW